MLYVEPVYVKSNVQNAYPLMQLVLVSYGDAGRLRRHAAGRDRQAAGEGGHGATDG